MKVDKKIVLTIYGLLLAAFIYVVVRDYQKDPRDLGERISDGLRERMEK